MVQKWLEEKIIIEVTESNDSLWPFPLMVDFFNKFYSLEMKICAKEARRLKSKIEFRRLIEKMKKRFLGLPGAVRSLRIFEEVGGGFGKKNLQGWERRSSGKFTILLVFLRKRRRWAFSFWNNTLQAWDPPTFARILRFNFSYETDFWANSFVAQKSSEMSPLSGSSPVFVSQPLKTQTF